MIDVLAVVVLMAVVAWAGVKLVRDHAPRMGLMSVPNQRTSHLRPTPHSGGLGVVLAGGLSGAWLALSAGWTAGWSVLALSLVGASTGLWDDFRPLSPTPRLLVLFAICSGVLLLVGELPRLELPYGLAVDGWALLLLALLAGMWWINLFNFMDGTDGIAGAQAVFMLLAAAGMAAWAQPEVTAEPAWIWMLCLAAASLGFLAHNWPPARVFMGDVGSTYLGFMIFAFATLSIQMEWIAYSTWLILAAVFVADGSVTLARRILRGERFLEAHRSHAYQRLSRRWRSHERVAVLVLLINSFWLSPLALAAQAYPQYEWPIAAIAYVSLFAGVLAAGAGLPDDA